MRHGPWFLYQAQRVLADELLQLERQMELWRSWRRRRMMVCLLMLMTMLMTELQSARHCCRLMRLPLLPHLECIVVAVVQPTDEH